MEHMLEGSRRTEVTLNSNSDSSSLSVPKLCDNGSNWADYELRLQKVMGLKGLWRHMEGTAPKPYVMADGIPVLANGKTEAMDEQIEVKEIRISEFRYCPSYGENSKG